MAPPRTRADSGSRRIEIHVNANRSDIEEGIKLVDLLAHELFENQSAKEKCRLVDFVFSNSTWETWRTAGRMFVRTSLFWSSGS